MERKIERRFLYYLLLLLFVVFCGLFSRSGLVPLPVFVSVYAGDVLWALMVFLGLCIIRPKWKTSWIFLAAIVFSYAIEFSQFYHAPWIDGLRSARLGGLVLGFGFKFSDLVCYSIGIALGASIDRGLLKFIK
ncbi:MAG: DUF2809 domain-containing protein [Planctomycetes bacterium]|nr:DUF2809 domain-containing protein [Planctomycetota bacterium]